MNPNWTQPVGTSNNFFLSQRAYKKRLHEKLLTICHYEKNNIRSTSCFRSHKKLFSPPPTAKARYCVLQIEGFGNWVLWSFVSWEYLLTYDKGTSIIGMVRAGVKLGWVTSGLVFFRVLTLPEIGGRKKKQPSFNQRRDIGVPRKQFFIQVIWSLGLQNVLSN